MAQRVSVYSVYTSSLKSGPRRQFGPRRSPERLLCFHRVIGPIRPYGNTHLHLGRSFGKTDYVTHSHFCCINRYARTRVASRPSRAIHLYSSYTLYSYSAVHGYTLHIILHIQLYIAIIHYTTSIQPTHPSKLVGSGEPTHFTLSPSICKGYIISPINGVTREFCCRILLVVRRATW